MRICHVILTLLATAASASAQAAPTTVPANAPTTGTIRVEAWLGGISQFIVQRDAVHWHHRLYKPPTIDRGRPRPTVINGTPWTPRWINDDGGDNEKRDSDTTTLTPPLPQVDLVVQTRVVEGAGDAVVMQQPKAENAHTLVVDMEGSYARAPQRHVIELTYRPATAADQQPLPPVDPAKLREDLVAEYLLNGSAEDSSVLGQDAQAIDTVPATDRFGRANSAMAFNGQSSYIEAPAPQLPTNQLTVSAWIRYSDHKFQDWHDAIVSQDGGSKAKPSERVFNLASFWGHAWADQFGRANEVLALGPALSKEQWHHVALTFDGRDYRLYVDGTMATQRHGQLTPSTQQPLRIGSGPGPRKPLFFSGAIDDVRLYRRALNDAEITFLYHENGWPAEAATAQGKK